VTSGAGKPYALKSQIDPDLEWLVQLPPDSSGRNIGVGRPIDLISNDVTR
jgi:hypothetical protein